MIQENYWSEYWKQGIETTFGGSSGYTGPILSHWQNVFNRASDGTVILDLASGNGALSSIANSIAHKRNRKFKIFANDLAEVKPASAIISMQDVQFYSNTPTENLPFQANLFSLIVSQYGFEYGDLNLSLAQVERVATKGATLSLICHSTDSIIVREATRLKFFLNELMTNLEILTSLRNLVVSMGNIKSKSDLDNLVGNRKSDRLRDDLNSLLAESMQVHGEALTHSDLPYLINELFESKVFASVDEKLVLISEYEKTFYFHIQRLEELNFSALKSEDIKTIQNFKSPKLGKLNVTPFKDENGSILGVLIENRGDIR